MREDLENNNVIVSEVTFIPLKPSPKGLIGIASVVYGNALCLNSISVYMRPNGELRLLFPVKVLPNSKEINVYYPINAETYNTILKAVEEKYRQVTAHISDW